MPRPAPISDQPLGYSAASAARHLNCRRETIVNQILRGHLPARYRRIKGHQQWWIESGDLLAYQARIEGTPPPSDHNGRGFPKQVQFFGGPPAQPLDDLPDPEPRRRPRRQRRSTSSQDTDIQLVE